MAAAGAGSRRQCEEYIVQGRVSVDGRVVRELGTKVDPDACEVRLDGERLRITARVYYMVNKPQGVITTCDDEMRRPSVVDLVGGTDKRIFPVGRLDAQSTGLVLLTNDGELAQRLTHPRYEVQKTYEVRMKGWVADELVARMKKGVWLSDGRATIEGVEITRRRPTVTDMRVTLHEGKNREIRRVMARLGHPVITLKRLSIGPLSLGELEEGRHRKLTSTEIDMLKRMAQSGKKRKVKTGR
jgi:23S rRNA pseudouridine2605 synthase